MLFDSINKNLTQYFTVLDDVTLEDIFPIRSDKDLTAWKFSFSDRVLFLPASNLLDVIDYASAYKLLLNGELYNIYNDYEVYGDEVGLVNKALGINNPKIVKTDEETSDCFKCNVSITNPLHLDDEIIEKKHHVGIFFKDVFEALREDNKYDEIIVIVKGEIAEIAAYLFRIQMELTNKDKQILCNKVIQCNDFALIKFTILRKEE